MHLNFRRGWRLLQIVFLLHLVHCFADVGRVIVDQLDFDRWLGFLHWLLVILLIREVRGCLSQFFKVLDVLFGELLDGDILFIKEVHGFLRRLDCSHGQSIIYFLRNLRFPGFLLGSLSSPLFIQSFFLGLNFNQVLELFHPGLV